MECLKLRRRPKGPATVIELMMRDKAVSRLTVWDLRMRVGPIPLRCGGIGGVGTDAEHRGKGYSRRVIEDSLAFMYDEGFHLAALFGIPDFYPRYGFAPALIDCEIIICTRDAEMAMARYGVREMQAEDVPAILYLYEKLCGRRTGSIVRDRSTWKRFRLGSGWTDRVGAFVVTAGHEVIGYASYNLDYWRFGCGEVGYRDEGVFGTLLAEMARRAVTLRVSEFAIRTPPDDPFAIYCRRYGCETKVTYPRNGSGMVCIINQGQALQLLQPLFAERLVQGDMNWPGSLLFCTELGEDRLKLGEGAREARIQLSHTVLTQWLMGYRSVRDALLESDLEIAPGVVPLLEVLFPPGYPYLWHADRF